jgi:trehalose-phosphatase
MKENQFTILKAFWEKIAASQLSLLILDYDGTLAPFHVNRHEAYPYPGVLPLLGEILCSGKTRIILVTGRPIQEVVKLLSPLHGLEIWGAHGLEHLKADGSIEHPEIDLQLTDVLRASEQKIKAKGWSDRLELKPGGVAAHWRGLPEQEIETIRSEVQNEWKPLIEQADLKLLQFDGGLELRLAHPDKGDAIRNIIRNYPAETPVGFLGDDITDEDGFRALLHRGLPILVRDTYRSTAAKIWIKPPQELLEFLEEWKRQIT